MAIIKVKTGGITADAITDALIADDVVGTEHLTANEVDTTALGADAVTGAQLADNAVNSEHYTDGSVDTAHIADANVTTAKVADDAITAAKINNDIISGITALAAEPADTDEFLVSDAGTLKRIDYSLIKGGGITMADQWRVTASATGLSGTSTKITSNWERTDTDGYGTIGSAMTESSGVFSFPATGIYFIIYKINGKSTTGSNNRYSNGNLYTSTDDTNFGIAARGASSGSGNLWDFETTAIFIFDVTNTSTHKVQFGYEFEASTSIYGNTNDSQTCVTFVRLGDT